MSHDPTRYRSIVELLEQRAAERPDATAFRFLDEGDGDGEPVTYRALQTAAKAIATKLQRSCKAGDRALLIYPPGLDYLRAFFGCLYAGVVAVPAYPPDPARLQRTLPRLQAIMVDAKTSCILTTSPIAEMAGALGSMVPEFASTQMITTDTVGADLAAAWEPRALTHESIAFLQYTSGSTGSPKGVVLSHGNLLHNASLICQLIPPDSVMVSWLPPYHDMGLIGTIIGPWCGTFFCVLMPPLAFLQHPIRWLKTITRFGATVTVAPNFAFDLCVRKVSAEETRALSLGSLNLVVNGAEPIRSETLDRFAAHFSGCGFRREMFYPCYGLAEATLIVTGDHACPVSGPGDTLDVDAEALRHNRVLLATPGEARTKRLVNCGTSFDQHVAIVDPENHHRLPDGHIGEIWVAGPSVARGYWGRPEESERACQARIVGEEGTPFLRTGDLGFLYNKGFFVAGRAKDLIVIRGHNLHPQDLELTAENAHRSLRRGSAAAFSVPIDGEEQVVLAIEIERRHKERRRASERPSQERRAGDRRHEPVTAAFAADNPQPFDGAAVVAAIREGLAIEHSIRPYAVLLLVAGSIPKTSSGKIQRHACRNGFLDGSLDVVHEWRDARTAADAADDGKPLQDALRTNPDALEAHVRHLVSRILGVPEATIQSTRPLFQYGIDSLVAVQLTGALHQECGLGVSFKAIFDGITLRQLVELAMAPPAPDPDSDIPPIPSDAPKGIAIASYVQERAWLIDKLSPNPSAANACVAIKLRGKVDRVLLERSLRRVIGRHDILRTTYDTVDGEVRPVVHSDSRVTVDLIAESISSTDGDIELLGQKLASVPFNLEHGPVLRACLCPLGTDEAVLFLIAHHIAGDAWSSGILVREIVAFYGEQSVVDATPLQYSAYAHWQRGWLRDKALDTRVDFWRRYLGTAPRLELPTDRPRPATPTFRGRRHRFHIDATAVAKLDELCKTEGVTRSMVALACSGAVLGAAAHQEEFVFGSLVAGRSRPELASVAGYLATSRPVRMHLSKAQTFVELLRRVKEDALSTRQYQDVPIDLLAERLHSARERGELFRIVSNFVTNLPKELSAPALTFDVLDIDAGMTMVDLSVELRDRGTSLDGALEYATDVFEAESIRALADFYVESFCRFVDNPLASLSDLVVPQHLSGTARLVSEAGPTLRIAVAATFTAELVEPSLAFWSETLALGGVIEFAPYNQVFQELLDDSRVFSRNQRGINVLLVRLQDWAKAGDGSAEDAAGALTKVVNDFVEALTRAGSRLQAHYILAFCPSAPWFPAAEQARALEREVAHRLTDSGGIQVITSEQILERYPVNEFYDARSDDIGHIPYTAEFFAALGTTIARTVHRLVTRPHKVLVLDCDQTLWRGVVGEDGPEGVELDAAHVALQQFAVAQQKAGMLLCLCSKNNEKDVVDVFGRHPEWPLRLEHIVARKINWRAKHDNLRELATELQLGLDSFVFIDDNPVECALVNDHCKEVLVLETPQSPGRMSAFLANIWAFDRLQSTEEDLKRTQLYRENLNRERLRQEASGLAEFIKALDLKIRFSNLDRADVPRAAQLTERTTQFNASGKRRSVQEFERLVGSRLPASECLVVRVEDRFGDYGLVGVLVFTSSLGALLVDTFLLSCRVLGRGVEHEMVARLGQLALPHGLSRVSIPFITTERNAPARDFLRSLLPRGSTAQSTSEFSAEEASSLRYAVQDPAWPRGDARESETFSIASRSPVPAGQVEPAARASVDVLAHIASNLTDANSILSAVEAWRKHTRPDNAAAEFVSPRTSVEHTLCTIWADVLGLERVGVYDDFFDLGGQSIAAIRVASRVRVELGVDIDLRDLLVSPTVASIASAIEDARITSTDENRLANALDEVEHLSDEEVRTLIAGNER